MSLVTGIDHIYLCVSDLDRAEAFYDRALGDALGFRKTRFALHGDPHVQYYCRHYGIVLRPARSAAPHDSYAPGLHHLAWTAADRADVDAMYQLLLDIGATILDSPADYPRYGPGYYAVFFADPDGLKLEYVHWPK